MILSVIFFLADHTEEMGRVYFKGSNFGLIFDFEFDFFEILLMRIGYTLILFCHLFVMCIIIQSARTVIFGISYTLTAHILK
jgi:hypothetical protein